MRQNINNKIYLHMKTEVYWGCGCMIKNQTVFPQLVSLNQRFKQTCQPEQGDN